MTDEIQHALEALRACGWRVSLGPRESLPPEISSRYPWLPDEYREVAEHARVLCNAGETAWVLTAGEFAGTSESAYAWNESEQQSLDAADDENQRAAVQSFWNRHLPILFSVKSGYAYLAIAQDTLQIVQGEEPEYEDATVVAPSFGELLRMFALADSKLSRWV
ncbi:MAG TPA: hypothetical protein VGG28_20100 [Kofleriaceae bacterium]|jgi:hypothetical protein